jgi:hypothetical protein
MYSALEEFLASIAKRSEKGPNPARIAGTGGQTGDAGRTGRKEGKIEE